MIDVTEMTDAVEIAAIAVTLAVLSLLVLRLNREVAWLKRKYEKKAGPTLTQIRPTRKPRQAKML